jgi:Bacterial PH domain/Short C-terminal domain
MGSYADSLLTDGEVVLRREHQHWLSLFLESRLSILLWIAGVLALVFVAWRNARDGLDNVVSIGALVLILLGVAFFIYRWWHWRTDEYVITNRRLLKVEGIINKRSADSSLEKINDAVLEVNLIGRIFDYGDLDILTAAEVTVDRYRMLNHAKTFKKEMMTAKHALEYGLDVRPSPPLRAQPSAATFAPPPPPPVVQPPDAHATARADSPDEVARSLARLAALRDSGAITAADYDAKKQELLSRL